MASEKAKKVAREIVGACDYEIPCDEYGRHDDEDACPACVLGRSIAAAIDQHGAACARLAAEYAYLGSCGNDLIPNVKKAVDECVNHAKEAQDE